MANQQDLAGTLEQLRSNVIILDNILTNSSLNLEAYMSRISLKDRILTNPNPRLLDPTERQQYYTYLENAGNDMAQLRRNLLTELKLELDLFNTEIRRADASLQMRLDTIARISLSKANLPIIQNPNIDRIKLSLSESQNLLRIVNQKYQNELILLPPPRAENSNTYIRRLIEREERRNRPAIGVESWFSKYMKYKNKYYALKNQKN
jgi:hypothetical protein